MMRAAVYDRYGPPEVLHVASVPTPAPGRGELLVRVGAVGVNGGELPARQGKLRLVLGNRFPQRTGVDLVGTVVARGEAVDDVALSDRVWGISESPIGTAAEYFAIRRDHVAVAPALLSDTDAVSLLAGGTTALVALRDKAHLEPGDRVLVRGSAGGVGSLVVQLAAARGAHVTALARASSLDFVKSLGADVALDHHAVNLGALGRFDVIVDSAGGDHRELRRLLNPGGRMVALTIDLAHPAKELAYLLASVMHGGRRVRFFRGRPRTPLLAELTALVDAGALRPSSIRSSRWTRWRRPTRPWSAAGCVANT